MMARRPDTEVSTTSPIYPPPDCPQRHMCSQYGFCGPCEGNFFTVAAQKSGAQRYHGSLTTKEAEAAIRSAITQAQENITYLRSKLQTHGDHVLSRWSKKSVSKKGALLSKAAYFCFGPWPPELAPQPSPGPSWYPEEKRELTWMDAPWLQTKQLAEDRTKLLTLLHMRTEHSMQSWAMFDTLESTELFMRALELPYNPHCVQMYGEGYGRLVEYKAATIHLWAIMGFPRALVTIQTQALISLALRQVVDEIVKDTEPTGNSKWLDVVPQLNRKVGETRWSRYEHPAFVAPYGFDTGVILDKVTSKLNELADHMELLQTDPEYMLNYVSTLKASQRFRDPTPAVVRWSLVAMDLVRGHRNRLYHWQSIVEACQAVHEVFEKYRNDIKPGNTLPFEVGRSLWLLQTTIYDAVEAQCQLFREALYRTTILKDHFAIVEAEVKGRYKWEHLRVLDPNNDIDRLLASAVQVENAMIANPPCGARDSIQLFLGKLNSVKYEKGLDDEISSIALLDEIRLAQTCSQLGPFENPSENVIAEARSMNGAQDSAHISQLQQQEWKKRMCYPYDHPHTRYLGTLLRNFYEAPWPKDHKSPTWLSKVSESRKRLTTFWKAAREEWLRIERFLNGPSINPEILNMIDSRVSHDTSQKYLEEVRKEREQGEADLRRKQSAQANELDAPQALQTTWGPQDNPATVNGYGQTKRTKLKTTGNQTADQLDVSALSLEDGGDGRSDLDIAETPSLPPIPVKRESLGVFRKMYASSTGSTPGSVKWTQLVQALTDAGLVATQAPGSAVTFASRDSGSINFHQPHDLVVDAFMLRYMGKRLRKWFGWDGDQFVLREKEATSMSE